jgi:hypothetical protein
VFLGSKKNGCFNRSCCASRGRSFLGGQWVLTSLSSNTMLVKMRIMKAAWSAVGSSKHNRARVHMSHLPQHFSSIDVIRVEGNVVSAFGRIQ